MTPAPQEKDSMQSPTTRSQIPSSECSRTNPDRFQSPIKIRFHNPQKYPQQQLQTLRTIIFFVRVSLASYKHHSKGNPLERRSVTQKAMESESERVTDKSGFHKTAKYSTKLNTPARTPSLQLKTTFGSR